MARSLDATMNWFNKENPENKVDTSDLDVSQRWSLLIGTRLLDICKLSTGLYDIEKTTTVQGKGNVKTEYLLVATPETLKWLTDRNEALEELWPVNLPMIVPPLPWAPGRRGGYRFNLWNKHPLVRGISREHAQKLSQSEMPVVYESLNRIQGTPWVINKEVVLLLEQLATCGGGMAGVPALEDEQEPEKPHDIETNEEARKKYRKLAHAAKNRNHERRLREVDFKRFLGVCRKFADERAIWFPHNLDFRGRVYPLTNYLSPQGDDMSKSVLKFAQGKALGENGKGWLALHGANCLGVTPDGRKLSKCSLDERVQWIVEHTQDILNAAAEPLVWKWWMKADDPLQFIAFCFEWRDFMALEAAGRGAEFVSSLPCSQDGTCNGLQHFSAMLRDPVGAAAVNVTPSPMPQDIYQWVADVVLKRLETEAVDNPLARMWLESKLVDRKLTKKPTMTFGYGSKVFGFRGQILEYVKSRDDFREKEQVFLTMDQALTQKKDEEQDEEETVVQEDTAPTENEPVSALPQASSYMATNIWSALGDVVVAAQKGMAWMQKCARIIAKSGKCVGWAVPGTNFRVHQEYVKEKMGQISTTLAGKVYNAAVYTKTDEPNVPKQANAVAPNVVHSLDAAALMKCVVLAASHGIENFHMVHDSYGTLAADCGLLADCIRRSFYALYSEYDVVGLLYEQFKEQAPEEEREEFPMPPEKGDLDLALVMESDYFFC